MKNNPRGVGTCIIGEVKAEPKGIVSMTTGLESGASLTCSLANSYPGSADFINREAADGTNGHLIAQNDIWNRLPQIQERRWQVVRSARTTCVLNSGRGVPVTGNPSDADGSGNANAHDYW